MPTITLILCLLNPKSVKKQLLASSKILSFDGVFNKLAEKRRISMPNDVDICVNKVLTRYLVLQKGFFRGPAIIYAGNFVGYKSGSPPKEFPAGHNFNGRKIPPVLSCVPVTTEFFRRRQPLCFAAAAGCGSFAVERLVFCAVRRSALMYLGREAPAAFAAYMSAYHRSSLRTMDAPFAARAIAAMPFFAASLERYPSLVVATMLPLEASSLSLISPCLSV